MRVIVHDQSGARVRVPFDGAKLAVGRQDGNDILLPARNISRRHCRLERDASGIWLADLASAIGLTVDGVQVHGRVQVLPGQVIGIGAYRLVLEREGRRGAGEI